MLPTFPCSLYLVAVWASGVLASIAAEALHEALWRDQGSQFTIGGHSHLDGRQGPLDGQRVHRAAVAIGTSRLAEFATGSQARTGIGRWMDFYAGVGPTRRSTTGTRRTLNDRSPGLRPVSSPR